MFRSYFVLIHAHHLTFFPYELHTLVFTHAENNMKIVLRRHNRLKTKKLISKMRRRKLCRIIGREKCTNAEDLNERFDFSPYYDVMRRHFQVKEINLGGDRRKAKNLRALSRVFHSTYDLFSFFSGSAVFPPRKANREISHENWRHEHQQWQ